MGSSSRWSLVAALTSVACASSDDEHDEAEPVDCDAAIVPLLALEDSDRFYVYATRAGEATAFVITDEASEERRVVVLDACGAEPRTILDHAWDVSSFAPEGPWLAVFSAGSPGGEQQHWICDPFGGRPNQQIPQGLWWYGELYPDGLVVHDGDESFALPYDERGFGEPEPAPPTPTETRACEIIVDGVSYWLTDERQIVADDPSAGTSTVVLEDVAGCGHSPDHAVMLLTRGSDDEADEWAFEPATGRVVDLPEASRVDMRSIMLEPQLRLLWLEEDWTTNWLNFTVGTAPDGTALLAADGDLYRIAPDETSLFWIGDGIGELVSIEFEDGAFIIVEREQSNFWARRLYRVALDGTGFTDLFGRLVYEPIPLLGDRWAFIAEGGLFLRDLAAQRERLIWADLLGPIEPLNWSQDPHRADLLFSGTDADGRNKTIYLARPDLID